jgi:hypothetical protein
VVGIGQQLELHFSPSFQAGYSKRSGNSADLSSKNYSHPDLKCRRKFLINSREKI